MFQTSRALIKKFMESKESHLSDQKVTYIPPSPSVYYGKTRRRPSIYQVGNVKVSRDRAPKSHGGQVSDVHHLGPIHRSSTASYYMKLQKINT